MVQLPPVAVASPRNVEPARYSLTVLPSSAVPVKAGVLSLVISSVFELPESLAAFRSGALGAFGAVLSMV